MTAQASWTGGDLTNMLDRWRDDTSGRPLARSQLEACVETALSDFAAAAVRLFAADGAAVVLCQDERPGWVIGSDDGARSFAHTAAALQDGPCQAALRRAEVVRSGEVPDDPWWPGLASPAEAHGVRAMVVVPVDAPRGPAGVCTLTFRALPAWDERRTAAARAFTRPLGCFLQVSAEAHAAARLAGQLQHALHHRVVIEQAKGALMERMDLSPKAAFDLLRTTARSSRRKVVDVAAAALARRALPGPSGPPAPRQSGEGQHPPASPSPGPPRG